MWLMWDLQNTVIASCKLVQWSSRSNDSNQFRINPESIQNHSIKSPVAWRMSYNQILYVRAYSVHCIEYTHYTVHCVQYQNFHLAFEEVILHEVRIHSDEVYCSSWICFRTGDIGRNLKAYEEQVLNLLRLAGGARKSDFKLVRPARSYSSISGPHSLVQLL